MKRFHVTPHLRVHHHASATWIQMLTRRGGQRLKTLPRSFVRAIQQPGVQYRVALVLVTMLALLLCVISLSAMPGPAPLA